ncbi:MAG: polysaccharide deacetylase family protein [Parabacteroides sp.]|nr:polysaccharide deacetylase family protein [Parabacteroides sp.]
MKYIALTFDDGREDNYSVAMPIMDKYEICGTVYITTGYIDGTWKDSSTLLSPRRPLNIAEICEMNTRGWEIGLHGDKHTTNIEDYMTSYEKVIKYLNGRRENFGFSVPNSNISIEMIEGIKNKFYPEKLSYIRRGRRQQKLNFTKKILLGLYTFMGLQWAYNLFNKGNTNSKSNVLDISSIVVRNTDSSEMILKFIDKVSDGQICVLMLHSILPSEEYIKNKNPWIWEESKLDRLCAGLKKRMYKDEIRVMPLKDILYLKSVER